MKKPSSPTPKSGQYVLGLKSFAKISAVEGIRLSASSKKMFAEFDRRGLSDEQRRQAIAKKHAKKA